MHTVLCSTPTRKRICRRFIRNYGLWEIVQSTYSDDRFKQAFRVGKETFYFILSKIESKIVKKNLVEKPISAEMRLTVCLFCLGRGDYHYTLGEMCGIAESTVKLLIQVDFVDRNFPKTEKEFKESFLEMDSEWQFPYAFCAIDFKVIFGISTSHFNKFIIRLTTSTYSPSLDHLKRNNFVSRAFINAWTCAFQAISY